NGNDVLADLAGEHAHLDELVVLEAIANDRRLAVGQRQHGEQFRLGAGLQAELELLAKVEDLLDDLALLIELDGVDAEVGSLVLELLDGVVEGLVNLTEPVAEDIGEAKQDRQLNAAGLKLIDQLLQVNGLVGALVGVDGDMPALVDGE